MQVNMPQVATRSPYAINRLVFVGALAVILVFGGFLAWAMLAPLASAVIAPGVVKVDSERKQIQHLDGGIVQQIFVRNGDVVEAGDILLTLDPTQAGASLAVLESALFSAKVQKMRLEAERDQAEVLQFAQMQDASEQEQTLLDAQLMLFTARQSVQVSQKQILEQQIDHLRKEIEGLTAQTRAKRRQIKISSQELLELRSLLDRGLTDKVRVLQLDRELAELQGELGELSSDVAGAWTTIDEKRLEIVRIERSFREQVLAELRETEQQLLDLRERVVAARHKLAHTEVRAPVEGIVVAVGVHTLGGVVAPGDVLLEIVPSNDELVVEAKLNPNDVDDVSLAMPARIKFSGLKQRVAPELNGSVNYVSADTLLDEQSGVHYYQVKISVPASEVKRMQQAQLQPGMPAEVFIQTGERTPMDYLLQPLLDSFDRAWREG
jgi:HlyD family secretion protein